MRAFCLLLFFSRCWLACDCRADERTVTLMTIEGHARTAALQTISHESLQISGEPPNLWSWPDVVWLRFGDDSAVPDEPRDSAVWLANGDRFVVEVVQVNDEQLTANWRRFPEWPPLALPLESVRGAALRLSHLRERRDETAAWILNRKETCDELRLLNSDRVTGEFRHWREGQIALHAAGSDVPLPTNDVRELAFNPEWVALPTTQELCWLVSLSDGSRFTLLASNSRFENNVLQAVHVTGSRWDIPLEAISDLRVLRGKAVFLSDLASSAEEHTPFLADGRRWKTQRDRSVAGRPLRLLGREFPKGIGMHSRSSITFDLRGQFRVFHAVVGLDDETRGRGTALCSVAVDGRRVLEWMELSRDKPAVRLPILNVTQANQLTLQVDFGQLGDSQDHVDWADAVLLPE